MTPTKVTTNAPRVLRGGGWSLSAASWVRPASRLTREPAGRGSLIGFRTTLAGRQPR